MGKTTKFKKKQKTQEKSKFPIKSETLILITKLLSKEILHSRKKNGKTKNKFKRILKIHLNIMGIF